jgi:hypothetical protein
LRASKNAAEQSGDWLGFLKLTGLNHSMNSNQLKQNYLDSCTAFDVAVERYAVAQFAYRFRHVGDSEFLKSSAEFRTAMRAMDDAEMAWNTSLLSN